MNILFLMAGEERFGAKDNHYPAWLIEIQGTPLIQKHVERFSVVQSINSMIFAIRESDARKYHLDNVISLVTEKAKFVKITSPTKGSACTALLAAQHINNDDPLLVLSVDEMVMADYDVILNFFRENHFDAGTVTFESVHPRYSFVRLDSFSEKVIEAAEKNPISRNATAGFYYFKHGKDFVQAAQSMIRKGAAVDGNFYICPVFNEMILNQKRVGVYKINQRQYLPIKSESQMNNFIESSKQGDFQNESL